VVTTSAADATNANARPARTIRHRALVGGLAATTALVIGIGVGPAGALDRLPGPWHRGEVTPIGADHAERSSGDDAVACGAPAAPTTTAPAVRAGAASVSQTVTVVVPPLVRVQSDADGMLSVVTNAARPPAPGDHVYRLQTDGNYTPADDALVSRVMTARWAAGSWCSTTAEHRSVG
jgi:hypothetical protein